MKNQRYFTGIILIGFGGYFLLQHTNIAFLQGFSGWPALLMIVGAALLGQGYIGHENELVFPGVILFGFGLHFFVVTYLHIWSDHIGIFVLIIALAYILKYQSTGAGLGQGLLFLAIASLLLFQERVTGWLGWLGSLEASTSLIFNNWPVILVLFGFYYLTQNKENRRREEKRRG